MKVNIKPMAASESLHSSQPNLSMPKNRRGAPHSLHSYCWLEHGQNLAYAPSLEAPGRCYHPFATTDTPTAVGFAICY